MTDRRTLTPTQAYWLSETINEMDFTLSELEPLRESELALSGIALDHGLPPIAPLILARAWLDLVDQRDRLRALLDSAVIVAEPWAVVHKAAA